jgi:A/G-specific adenine glycosylase
MNPDTAVPIRADVSVSRMATTDFVEPLLAWGRINRRSFPWRETANPFHILVAEILLQRSRGKSVARVITDLTKRWPTPESLSQAPAESIRSVIRPLGLTRRAETLIAMSAAIVARGGVPTDVNSLMKLPGVGRYAASATATVAFGSRNATVDGVTARVYRRFFGSESDLPASNDPALWELVDDVTPECGVREWNWAVLDLAAMVCLPARPKCEICPVFPGCALSPARLIASAGRATLAPTE